MRPCYELFNACGGSCPSLPGLWHYITFSCIPLSSSFVIEVLSSHVVAYILSFESRFETWKSDIIRLRYELFNAFGGSCPSLPCLWHYITFSFIRLISSLRIEISSYHVVAYIVSFDSRFQTRKSDIIGHAMTFIMHAVAHVPHYLVFDTILPFLSFLLPRDSELRFFYPMS